MDVLDNLNCDEKEAMEKLRSRLEKDLTSEMYEDSLLFYRFLKARDFDVGKAEVMLRKHLIWRKAYQLDNYFEIFKPFEMFEKFLAPSIIGFDKDGDIIIYLPSGKHEMKDITKCIKMNDLEKGIIWIVEKVKQKIKMENEKHGRNNYQSTVIIDLDKLTFSNATNRVSAEIVLRLSEILQDNYPEILKSVVIINAPAYYIFVFAIVKRLLSHAMMKKIQIFSQNGWKDVLLNVIDADVLPAFLGGNRTDPDGNPLCLTFMSHDYNFLPKYYLSYNDRWFKDKSQVKKISIPPKEKRRVFVEVEERGSLIQWEFEVRGNDIRFGLSLEEDEREIEILPIIKYTTSDGTEKFHYNAQCNGKYVIIFENTHSWISSKDVYYCVTVSDPET